MHGEPLDEVIYCEVMFDQGISGEIPEHRDFICRTAIPRLKKWGILVTVLRDPSTYVDNVTHLIRRGPKRGMIRGFPLCGRCAIQRDCKARPINRYLRKQKGEVVQTSALPATSRSGWCGWRGRRCLCWTSMG